MIEIRLSQVQAGVAIGDNGDRITVLADSQSGITVLAPFTEEGAREIAAGLNGIAIANGMPLDPAGLRRATEGL